MREGSRGTTRLGTRWGTTTPTRSPSCAPGGTSATEESHCGVVRGGGHRKGVEGGDRAYSTKVEQEDLMLSAELVATPGCQELFGGG